MFVIVDRFSSFLVTVTLTQRTAFLIAKIYSDVTGFEERLKKVP